MKISLRKDHKSWDDWYSWQHERSTKPIRCTCKRCATKIGIWGLPPQVFNRSDPVQLAAERMIKRERTRKRARVEWYKRNRKKGGSKNDNTRNTKREHAASPIR